MRQQVTFTSAKTSLSSSTQTGQVSFETNEPQRQKFPARPQRGTLLSHQVEKHWLAFHLNLGNQSGNCSRTGCIPLFSFFNLCHWIMPTFPSEEGTLQIEMKDANLLAMGAKPSFPESFQGVTRGGKVNEKQMAQDTSQRNDGYFCCDPPGKGLEALTLLWHSVLLCRAFFSC